MVSAAIGSSKRKRSSSTTGNTKQAPQAHGEMRCKIQAKFRQMRSSPEQISGWLSEQGIKRAMNAPSR